MKVNNALRKQQLAITAELKARAQKAEKLLGEIEICEQTLANLNEALSVVLGIGSTPAAAIKSWPVAVARIVKPNPVLNLQAGGSGTLRNSILDLLAQAGKPMRLAEIVKGIQAAGHVFMTKNPLKTTSKMLYGNKKVFKKVGPGLFKAG
ncbi:MAG: HTH domain-containing protein [Kiritimatiellia bacterium]